MNYEPRDFEKAILDPSSVFRTPEEVLEDTDLSHAQKREILRRWAYDASKLSTAEGEGMAGGEPSLIQQVVDALDKLAADAETN